MGQGPSTGNEGSSNTLSSHELRRSGSASAGSARDSGDRTPKGLKLLKKLSRSSAGSMEGSSSSSNTLRTSLPHQDGADKPPGAVFEASLPPDLVEMYRRLAVLLPQAPVPLVTVLQLWGCTEPVEAQETVQIFVMQGVLKVATLPDVAHHLLGAGEVDKARALLLDPAWLEMKLHCYGVAAVVEDFRTFLQQVRQHGSQLHLQLQ
eukprot:gene3661-3922_t